MHTRLTCHSKFSRTAQLEGKLDNLVSLLTTTRMPASNISSEPNSRSASSLHSTEDLPPPALMSPDAHSWAGMVVSCTDPGFPQFLPANSYISGDLGPEPGRKSTADDQLRAFQGSMASYFPFVVIPEGVPAESLKATKPFLYDNIMMVTSYSKVFRQSSSRSMIIRSFTEQVLLQGKKSLDLLQGIVVFAAWYHHHLWSSPQLTNMIQLATALIFDLGLHRAQSAYDGRDVSTEGIKSFRDRGIGSPRTLEERRVFLGLLCLSRG
jgi:hypothetical protein